MKVRMFVNLVIFTILMNGLVSCSFFSTSMQRGDKQYLQAQSIAPLKIPPGINSAAFHNEYPVSDRNDSHQNKEISIVPPGL